MTTEQIQILKKQLLKKGSEINEKLTALMNGLDPAADLGLKAKPGESKIERLRRFLTLVDTEIQRVRAGSYGHCVTCNAEIPFEQLEQIPWIDTCQACAAKASA